MIIWGLLGDVEYDIAKKGMDNLNKQAEMAAFGDIKLKLIWLDYLELDQEPGKGLVVKYEGEELELPDMYWLMVGNTDGRYVEKLLEAAGVKPLIPLAEVDVARCKVLTYDRLAKANLPFPKTKVFFKKTNMTNAIAELGYPFVIKPNGGHGGFGVELIQNEEEWKAYQEKLLDGETYIAQEYVSTSRGRDLRVILLNGEVIGAVTRTSQNPEEFRSNVDQGGTKEHVEPDALAVELAEKASVLFDIPLLSVDFMYTENGYTITEVNAFPGSVRPDQREQVIRGVLTYYKTHQNQGKN